jgi:O-acetyl-ADP-ribose deacetylase (regulator of RNase III)
MTYGKAAPDPTRINTLADLVQAFNKLRRRGAGKGQVQLSIRDLAARTNRPPSTLDAYLRGKRLCPADVYEDLLRVLGIAVADLRPWLEAWERIADGWRPESPGSEAPAQAKGRPVLLPFSETFLYRLVGQRHRLDTHIGVVTGDVRRVVDTDVWVNSENTDMVMSRFTEYSISAIIRFEGATRDENGRVIKDVIAEELKRKVSGRTPVAAGSTITTGAGELGVRNGVRHIIHVAAVHGEPGEGYRQVADIGRCVTNVLREAERLATTDSVRSVLLPLLGTGVAGGDLDLTVHAMVGAVVDHFARRGESGLRVVCLLASTARERDACRAVLGKGPFLEWQPA